MKENMYFVVPSLGKNQICKLKCAIIIILSCITFSNFGYLAQAQPRRFPIGVVFGEEKSELHSAFSFAIADLANYSLDQHGFKSELIPQIDFIPSTADSCNISQYVQSQVVRGGILAIVNGLTGARQAFAFLSHTHRLQIPFISPKVPVNLVQQDNGAGLGIGLQPIGMQSALLDLISHYNYKKFIYLYNGYEGIFRLEAFHDLLNAGEDSIGIAMAKKFQDTAEALEILEHIESSYRWTFKLIVLDCPIPLAKKVLLGHVADRSLGRRTYHYLISGFAFDEHWDADELLKVSYLNVTGFRIINPDRPYVKKYMSRIAKQQNPDGSQFKPILTANGAFLYDCILVLQEGFSQLFGKENSTSKPHKFLSLISNLPGERARQQNNPLQATLDFQQRKEIIQELRDVKIEGLTGAIRFAENGVRKHYSIDIMEVNIHGEAVKIGEWKDGFGFSGLEEPPVQEDVRPYIVTSILEEPLLMKVDVPPGQTEPEGNAKYEGFVKEFMDSIAERLNISYEIQIVKDRKHGSKNSSLPGGWDGMVGELVRHEADLAVAGLTVNADREMAIHLSKPFMFVGISIMIYKAGTVEQMNQIYADVFEFMRPLSRDTWICVGIAYLGVCLVLFALGRCNRKELDTIEKHGQVKVRTQFTASNSFWFTFASLVSQGTPICPRSIACRLVGSVWWFFTLILISSYTANFAAFQTVNRMVQPINSVSDLVAQKKVSYGLLEGGATQQFFKSSRAIEYQKMHKYMSTTKGVNVRSYDEGISRVRREQGMYAFLLESLKNEYVNRRKPCDTMRVGGNLDMNGWAIGLSKKTRLRVEDVSRVILEFRGSGHIEDLQNKWWPQKNECEGMDESIPKEERGRLSMRKLAGVFYVLIGGIVLALLISLFEIWWKRRGQARSAPAPENLRNSPKPGNQPLDHWVSNLAYKQPFSDSYMSLQDVTE